ncbi:hypothetical protein K9M47_02645 [Candidatus Gracilibacteria bacterium]|nr:hypothetical protein [Candidatus Gracilibacteria bacterium]
MERVKRSHENRREEKARLYEELVKQHNKKVARLKGEISEIQKSHILENSESLQATLAKKQAELRTLSRGGIT